MQVRAIHKSRVNNCGLGLRHPDRRRRCQQYIRRTARGVRARTVVQRTAHRNKRSSHENQCHCRGRAQKLNRNGCQAGASHHAGIGFGRESERRTRWPWGRECAQSRTRKTKHVAEQTRLQGLHLTSLLRKGLGLHGGINMGALVNSLLLLRRLVVIAK